MTETFVGLDSTLKIDGKYTDVIGGPSIFKIIRYEEKKLIKSNNTSFLRDRWVLM